ncbi:cell division protein FtsQ [Nitrosomonas sp. Nm51]|uniref:cell division protein FtsQ/DivIB n=1 Tax=Nitrosomonas sp. Nm51 TaxID=133720 RepID=UPI0008BF14D0|nr:cell division protein FtsQ/DivIB [Nitrosomonas sp. Nm51]SER30848.1 cell division protein FtsQ [Nitrosomonas sp. Nm51]
MWDNCRLLNFVSGALFLMAATVLIYTLVQHYGLPRFLPLKTVNVQGMHADHDELKHITREQIETIVRRHVQGNFLSVNLIAVRDAFTRLPWVRDAKVERDWPLALNIRLEEHQVLAHWGSHALVNSHGEVFRVVLDEKMPVFTAPMEANSKEITRRYRQFSKALAPLQQSISEINLSSRHAWRIHLNTGTVLELGRHEIEKRLQRYVSVYHHSIAHLNQDKPLAYVDLRYTNGFAVYMPEAEKPLKNKQISEKET